MCWSGTPGREYRCRSKEEREGEGKTEKEILTERYRERQCEGSQNPECWTGTPGIAQDIKATLKIGETERERENIMI